MAHHHQSVGERENNIMVSYSDVSSSNPPIQTHLVFDPNSEIYNLATGVEMIGFQPKPTNNPDLRPMGLDLYGHSSNNHDDHHDDGGGFVYESSLRTCVFPCEGNEKPSQGLSLSVSSSNPSTIGLQSFELRHQNHHHHHHHNQRLIISSSNSRDAGVIMGKSPTFPPQEEVFLGKSAPSASTSTSTMNMQFELMRNSKYLGPTQELLYEFCNLGTNQNCDDPHGKKKKNKEHLIHTSMLDGGGGDDDHDDDDHANRPFSSSSQSLYGLSLLELQKRKTRLLGMLEELDRRYKRYCEQMKTVVSSFEVVASTGAANVYSALASKAMSRHFRCLRDAIIGQIKATKKAMGEKDAATLVPGSTKGETPRLRILDQALRQQRAFQQMTMMETHPWRPQRGLPERSVSVLRAWLFEHFLHPYPSDVDKHILARQTGLTRGQVSNWFINARVRLWKPMVEQMYLEETKEEHDNNNMGSSSDVGDHQPNEPHRTQPSHDQKRTPDQLVRIDPECLSSIVNTTTTTNTAATLDRNDQFGRADQGFGSAESLDFPSSSSYHHQQQHATYSTQNDNNAPQGFGGGNVSLTLGLQQHGVQNSLFYGRDHIDDCQTVQYSLLDGDQGQNLRYRNLMGAQLLHDFA